MTFRPKVGDIITIEEISYQFAEHPNAPGMVYGQEGRAGIVYRLRSPQGDQALKVFKPRFSTPGYVSQAEAIARYAELPGLRVCSRVVLTPSRYEAILRQHKELTYSVAMPWVEGGTWQEWVQEGRELSPSQALGLARTLVKILVGLEERNLAHCDISGSNLIIVNPDENLLELVDVEGMYAPGLFRPEVVTGGSPGYAHKSGPAGLWSPQSDRFTGAVLLGEILGWSSPDLRQMAYGETYFDPAEIQTDCPRYQALLTYLEDTFGVEASTLFCEAWRSETLSGCPTFGHWLVTLPDQLLEHVETLPQPIPLEEDLEAKIQWLLKSSEEMEAAGIPNAAVLLYQQALNLCEPDGTLGLDIRSKIEKLSRMELQPEVNPDIQEENGESTLKNGGRTSIADRTDSVPAVVRSEKTESNTGGLIFLGLVCLILLGLLIGLGLEYQKTKQLLLVSESSRSALQEDLESQGSAMQATIDALYQNHALRIYNSSTGSLIHEDDDNLIEMDWSGVSITNGIAEATFVNPYASTEHPWDYGFVIRSTGSNLQYRLSVSSDPEWRFLFRQDDHSSLLDSGVPENLNLGAGEQNSIRLIFLDGEASLYINDQFISNLDISGKIEAGDVGIGTGFYNGNEISGYQTNYHQFTVWQLP